ncbi:uncharacterized protein PRCAT00001879001 [Priceomyces carsonii]|uniref:uncharacterized protein n=1 Tax=Priceomyces carsonii TaxID=28549 RepID=UPI002ED81EB7|nr:unnamed protein product [Priceomyces carsonii]
MKETALYGGAIHTVLPEDAIDVSKIRQVPDTQEVFILEKIRRELDRSLIFDLLERVPNNYEKVIELHIEDLIDSQESNHLIERVHQKFVETDIYFSFAMKGSLVVLISLLRLERAETDVLISMNINVEENYTIEQIKEALLNTSETRLPSSLSILKEDYDVIKEASLNLQIKDWSLFEG